MARRRLPRNPALTTVSLFALVAAILGLLYLLAQGGDDASQEFADSDGFHAWLIVAALVGAAYVDTLQNGVRALLGDADRPTGWSLAGYVGCFLVFAALVLVVLRLGGSGGPPVPLDNWAALRDSLLALGFLAAGPWVITVWMAHARLADVHDKAGKVRPVAAQEASDEPAARDDLDGMLHDLLELRGDLKTAVLRLLVVVMGAVLTSGALHGALVPDYVSEKAFPASSIVLYGAFFAVMLSLAVIPLMTAWRRAASTLVDQAYPLSVSATPDTVEARARLASTLDTDGSLFQSPVALSTILAPLVTSALAVFIPQLGG